MGKSSDYHRMSVAEKERHNRQHAPPTRCPRCDVAIQAEDLVAHARERCPGRPEVHPRSRWVNYRQAVQMGVTKRTLYRWVARDKIRTKGEKGQKRYLLVDIAKQIAIHGEREARRRAIAKEKPAGKTLTSRSQGRQAQAMAKQKSLSERIAAIVEKTGSYSAASRKLDVPVDSLRKAAKGENIRRGTQILIETQLSEVGE